MSIHTVEINQSMKLEVDIPTKLDITTLDGLLQKTKHIMKVGELTVAVEKRGRTQSQKQWSKKDLKTMRTRWDKTISNVENSENLAKVLNRAPASIVAKYYELRSTRRGK